MWPPVTHAPLVSRLQAPVAIRRMRHSAGMPSIGTRDWHLQPAGGTRFQMDEYSSVFGAYTAGVHLCPFFFLLPPLSHPFGGSVRAISPLSFAPPLSIRSPLFPQKRPHRCMYVLEDFKRDWLSYGRRPRKLWVPEPFPLMYGLAFLRQLRWSPLAAASHRCIAQGVTPGPSSARA
jgi:hypothetical protein